MKQHEFIGFVHDSRKMAEKHPWWDHAISEAAAPETDNAADVAAMVTGNDEKMALIFRKSITKSRLIVLYKCSPIENNRTS